MNAAANIFVGQAEAPLMIKPYFNDMTNSEIHAVMTGGFATIAGAALAGYIRYFARMNTCNTVDIEKKMLFFTALASLPAICSQPV